MVDQPLLTWLCVLIVDSPTTTGGRMVFGWERCARGWVPGKINFE